MLRNLTTGRTIASRVVRCDTFWRRARGLMFRSAIGTDEVYLFIESRESVAQTTIHMFFVFFPIAVIWLDRDKRVVDKAQAQPFRPFYAPGGPAQYFVEGEPSILDLVSTGDQLVFE